jgi:hypothetical protein
MPNYLGTTARLIGALGNTIREIQIQSIQHILDVSELPAGYYIIQFDADQEHSHFFIKN